MLRAPMDTKQIQVMAAEIYAQLARAEPMVVAG
jgi:hypothetical protein